MIRLGTVFSGIGSVEQALKRMNIDYKVIFACDNGDMELKLFDNDKQKKYKDLKTKVGKRTITEEEKKELVGIEREELVMIENIRHQIQDMPDKNAKREFVEKLYGKTKKNFVKQTYLANYDLDEKDFHIDIRFLDGRDYTNQLDLLVGGSPCQSFSTVGAERGLEDTRGTLFYEFARIIQETNPKVFIYENVRGLTTHDEGRTWETIQSVFRNDLHYRITEPQVLNAADFGIPQTRRRLFVIGIREDIECGEFEYPQPIDLRYHMQDFQEENCAYGHFSYDKNGELCVEKVKGKPDNRFTLTPKVRDYVLTSGTKTFRTSTKTDMEIARTLVKTMTQHHRAGVDNYITIGEDAEGKKILRSLTDREALRLMGYPDAFNIVVSPMQIFRQAGNSIVVDVMMAVLKQIFKTNVFK